MYRLSDPDGLPEKVIFVCGGVYNMDGYLKMNRNIYRIVFPEAG